MAMRYIIGSGAVGNKQRMKRLLAALHVQYPMYQFKIDYLSIYITSTEDEAVRTRCRAFALGFATAKGWR